MLLPGKAPSHTKITLIPALSSLPKNLIQTFLKPAKSPPFTSFFVTFPKSYISRGLQAMAFRSMTSVLDRDPFFALTISPMLTSLQPPGTFFSIKVCRKWTPIVTRFLLRRVQTAFQED